MKSYFLLFNKPLNISECKTYKHCLYLVFGDKSKYNKFLIDLKYLHWKK